MKRIQWQGHRLKNDIALLFYYFYFTITKSVLFELCCLIVRECCSARFTLKEHQNVIGEEQGTKPVTGVSLRHSGYPSFL